MVNLWFSILRTIMAIAGKLALGGAEFCQPRVRYLHSYDLKCIVTSASLCLCVVISFVAGSILYINEG